MAMSPVVGGRKSGRGRRGVPRYGAMADINMTPFIDVMLVLLIIFMVAAPLLTTGVVGRPAAGERHRAQCRAQADRGLAQRAGPALCDGPADRRRGSGRQAPGGVAERRRSAHLPSRLEGRCPTGAWRRSWRRSPPPGSRRWPWSPSRSNNSRERRWKNGGHIRISRAPRRCTGRCWRCSCSASPRRRRFADTPEAIPIETVSLSELNQIANGEKDAKPAPQPAPAPPQPPAGPARVRGAAAAAAAGAAASPQTAPPPKADTPPPKPASAAQSGSDASARAGADAARKTRAAAPAEARHPGGAGPAAGAAKVHRRLRLNGRRSRRRRSPSRRTILTRTRSPSSSDRARRRPPSPTQTAAATPQGLPHHDAPHMSMSMASALDAWLTESYLNCWTPPPGMPDGDTYVAEIRVIFNPDGSLSGRPVLLNPPTDRAWRAHAESAMRAVRKCDPLKVPAEYMPYFEQWKVETIHFDPRETQG